MGMVGFPGFFFILCAFTHVVLAAAGGSNRSLSTVGDPAATNDSALGSLAR